MACTKIEQDWVARLNVTPLNKQIIMSMLNRAPLRPPPPQVGVSNLPQPLAATAIQAVVRGRQYRKLRALRDMCVAMREPTQKRTKEARVVADVHRIERNVLRQEQAEWAAAADMVTGKGGDAGFLLFRGEHGWQHLQRGANCRSPARQAAGHTQSRGAAWKALEQEERDEWGNHAKHCCARCAASAKEIELFGAHLAAAEVQVKEAAREERETGLQVNKIVATLRAATLGVHLIPTIIPP